MQVADHTYILRLHGHYLCQVAGGYGFKTTERNQATALSDWDVKKLFQFYANEGFEVVGEIEIINFISAI